jgi:hypothetical protein
MVTYCSYGAASVKPVGHFDLRITYGSSAFAKPVWADRLVSPGNGVLGNLTGSVPGCGEVTANETFQALYKDHFQIVRYCAITQKIGHDPPMQRGAP